MIFPESPRSPQRSVHLALTNEPLGLFLAALLEEWHFVIVPDPARAELVLVEAGVDLPPLSGMIIRLSSFATNANALQLPMTIPALSTALEQALHRPPRGHLRVSLPLPARLLVRAESLSVTVLSLSDAGARFELPHELTAGEKVIISLDIDDHDLLLTSSVIYAFHRNGPGDSDHFSTGVIFTQLPPEKQQLLSEFIIRSYLQRVQDRIPSWAFAVALSHFDLPPALRVVFDRL